MKITPEETIQVSDGRYEAVISKVEEREQPFHYIDYFFKVESNDKEVEIKQGFPAKVGYSPEGKPTTSHAKFLKNLGVDVTQPFETDELIGKKVTINVENDEKGFAKIIGTVKLVE